MKPHLTVGAGLARWCFLRFVLQYSSSLSQNSEPPICLAGALPFGSQYSEEFSTEARRFLILFPNWLVVNEGQEGVRRSRRGCVDGG